MAPFCSLLCRGVVACVDWQTAFRAKEHVACQAVPLPALVGLEPQESLEGDMFSGEEEAAESEEPEVDSEVDPDSDWTFGPKLNQ